MYFQHTTAIWSDFPRLVPGVLAVEGVSVAGTEVPGDVAKRLTPYFELARVSLGRRERECAAESLARRFRKDGALPRIHPLVDICNAVSLAYATPIAVFDLSAVTAFLEVRRATGEENYRTFGGEPCTNRRVRTCHDAAAPRFEI